MCTVSRGRSHALHPVTARKVGGRTVVRVTHTYQPKVPSHVFSILEGREGWLSTCVEGFWDVGGKGREETNKRTRQACTLGSFWPPKIMYLRRYCQTPLRFARCARSSEARNSFVPFFFPLFLSIFSLHYHMIGTSCMQKDCLLTRSSRRTDDLPVLEQATKSG